MAESNKTVKILSFAQNLESDLQSKRILYYFSDDLPIYIDSHNTILVTTMVEAIFGC